MLSRRQKKEQGQNKLSERFLETPSVVSRMLEASACWGCNGGGCQEEGCRGTTPRFSCCVPLWDRAGWDLMSPVPSGHRVPAAAPGLDPLLHGARDPPGRRGIGARGSPEELCNSLGTEAESGHRFL